MTDPGPPDGAITISDELGQRIQDELGQNVYLCYQCFKCTSGCPVAEFFDWQPNQIMRAVQLGQESIAFESQTPWLCAACQMCTTRCPQGLDINGIMEFLTREAKARGYEPQVPEVGIFDEAFMREIRLWGRAYELGLLAEMKLRTRDFKRDLDLGIQMLRKRKLSLLPTPKRSPRRVKPLAGAVEALAYYPGCSLHSTAKEFNLSAKAVCEQLGMRLIEPKGWICCGSSAAHRADPQAARRLPMENLAMVEQSGFREVTMPCAACFNRHKTAQYEFRHDEAGKRVIDEAIGYQFRDTVRVTTLLDAIRNHVGLENVAEMVNNPLTDLRVVCYYGCLLTRPPSITEADHPENPTAMDEILEMLGADVVDWSYKTMCCGAAHSVTRPDIVLKLSGNLIQHARESGADLIAVACPLCHTNLDARQLQMELEAPMPVLYFTQLMALAFGLTEKSTALDKNLIDPRPLLLMKGVLQS